MAERGILFNASMVRAILGGSKTQTRRVVKPQPNFDIARAAFGADATGAQCVYDGEFGGIGLKRGDFTAFTLPNIHCPYGQPGDRLWVRETVADVGARLTYRADTDDGAHCMVKRWTPSIHMPRHASRILLQITSVRVERLQDISEKDAIAEGIRRVGPGWERWHPDPDDAEHTGSTQKPRLSYLGLWESINGAGSWNANPWVWVVEFKRVSP